MLDDDGDLWGVYFLLGCYFPSLSARSFTHSYLAYCLKIMTYRIHHVTLSVSVEWVADWC